MNTPKPKDRVRGIYFGVPFEGTCTDSKQDSVEKELWKVWVQFDSPINMRGFRPGACLTIDPATNSSLDKHHYVEILCTSKT